MTLDLVRFEDFLNGLKNIYRRRTEDKKKTTYIRQNQKTVLDYWTL